ncbi:MAG: glycosyltransferase [Gammaproteobacteria bacterium]|nr:glycosyltransferase [Gammaproteobacteria bacterium]MBU1467864.1 glycosyltransferase [Gammaproteobacteria bacterium]MBU2023232.1 glycosyltransferase [Gammaproteobacteria bacterium]MBU2240643.1 glycosyltransferase [Gammaproteobacteria bacterium]MBU2317847.1 glycosyltransferase [Gammaproteobacteria bacterium]
MKILIVITGLGMGGAEHVVVNLADSLSARGYSVKIVYLTGEAVVLPKNTDIEIFSVGMKSINSFFFAYFKLYKIIKKFKPDVVHGHMFHANLITRLLRLSVKIPKLISTAHSNNEGGKLRMLAYRLTNNLADGFTNVSQDAVDTFVRRGAAPQGRMQSVVNGIDLNRFSFDPEVRIIKRTELNCHKNIILAVGRLDTPKDYPNLLNAIKILSEKRNDFKVLIAGDGRLKEMLEMMAINLNIANFVNFIGVRHDVHELMSAADIFVLSSSWEGFGLVVAEAMACERIVVATDCGGVREVVDTCGFLVPPENSLLLARSLGNALDLSYTDRSKHGILARQRIIDKFSLDSNINSFIKMYTS